MNPSELITELRETSSVLRELAPKESELLRAAADTLSRVQALQAKWREAASSIYEDTAQASPLGKRADDLAAALAGSLDRADG